MRIRVARRMYGQFVAAGKGACCGELINPVSEVRGEPPYRTVFTVNPMENFEISEVLVSEEDMEKIQQLQEVLINVNGEVLARRKDGNTPTLEYYLTKVQTRYVEHKGSLLDFRKENIQITKKRVRRTDGVRARNRILEHGFRRSHPPGCAGDGCAADYKDNRTYQPQIPNGVSKKRIPKAGSGHQKLCQKRSVPVL